jgi:hypothetical protein
VKRYDAFVEAAPPQAVADNARLERRAPVEDWRQALLVPTLSLSLGLVILVGVSFLCLGFDWPLRVALVAAGIAMIAAAFTSAAMFPAVLFKVETITGKDWNRDNAIGAPHFIIEMQDQRSVRYVEIPGAPDSFARFAYAALTDGTLAESAWCGGGKPYSKPAFLEMRDELTERGWLEWNNPRHHSQGVRLTERGRYELQLWLEAYGSARTAHTRENGRTLLTHAPTRAPAPALEAGDDE